MNVYLRCGKHPLREWLEEGNVKLDYTFRTRHECQYVTDLVGETWRYWDPGSPVIISAPTGTGKNRFVEEVILRHVLTNYRSWGRPLRVLLVQNRTTLRRQTIVRIAKTIAKYTGDARYLDALGEYTDAGLDRHFMRLGIIFVTTYQHLATLDGERLLQTGAFDFIVMDEAHFFTTDARFNAETETILRNIVRYGCNATRIFMSATIETAFEPIVREEYEEWQRKQNRLLLPYDPIAPFTPQRQKTFSQSYADFSRQSKRFLIRIYDLPRDYGYLSGLHRISVESLPEEIVKGNGRWLVFVANIKDGQTLCTNLKGKNINAVFLNRESKGSAAFSELVKSEALDARVIIATAVIDNGVNLKDERITDVAILVFDRVEFLQMLGRVRVIKDSQTIRLWASTWGTEDLENLLRAEIRTLIDCLSLEGLTQEEKDPFIEAYLQYRSCFGVNSIEGLHYSHHILYPLLESIQRLSGILRNLDPEFAVSIDDESPYFARALKIFYAAGKGKLPMSDAVSRTLFGLNLLDDPRYMEAQIPWKRTEERDDSFLYILYTMRIKNLEETLNARAIPQNEFSATSSMDFHPTMTIEALKKELRRQNKLLARFGKSCSAWEEVHFWLELDPPKEKKVLKNSGTIELSSELLLNNSILAETLRTACPKEKVCHDKKLLAQYGLKKDDFESLETSKAKPVPAFIALKSYYGTMANNAGITGTQIMNKSKKTPVRLDDFAFWVTSVLSPSHETFYVILRTPIGPS